MDEFNNDFLSSYNQRDEENLDSRPGRKASQARKPDKPSEPDGDKGRASSGNGKPATPAPAVKKAADSGYRYEQKSGFKPPERRESAALPPGGGSGRNKKLITILAAGGALVILIIVLVLALTAGTSVEQLVGRTQTEAQLWATQNGLNLQVSEVYSDDVEAGVIISQEPPAGTRVKKGAFVYVTVSEGPDLSVTLTLPDLLNMTKDEVEAWAKANHMTKVRITTEFSDTVPAGKVIRYEINDNTVVGNEVRRDTPVYVIVSKGIDTSVEMVEIPDFKTMTLAECYAFANDNGLVLSVTEQYDDYIPEGSIISSSVKEKEKVPRGTEIKLVASKGKKIEIPDFSDYTKETALSVASGLGIPVTVIEKYSGSAEGAFISQSIPAGTIYEKGDFLELHYSLGNKIVVPSFVGQTRDAIESWALDLNSKGARITISATTTNSSQPAGTIIYQTPANTTVGVKKTISITVSKGQVVYVPDFTTGASSGYDVAITREQAIAMCEELKLVPVFEEGRNSNVLPGAIWKQSLKPGTETVEGQKITLTYAPNETYAMINFYGLKQEQAMQQGNSYFKLVFVPAEAYVDAVDPGVIVRQSIAANTVTARGTTVTLYINPSP